MKKYIIFSVAVASILSFIGFSFASHEKPEINNHIAGVCSNPFESIFTPPIEKEWLFSVRGDYYKTLTQKQLREASSIADLVEYYPNDWFKNYDKVTLILEHGGQKFVATAKDDRLNNEQKSLLEKARISDNIEIKVDYQLTNEVTGELEDHQMKIGYTIVPAKEASYAEGYDALIKYFVENTSDETFERDLLQVKPMAISFMVAEDGKILDINLTTSSEDPKLDQQFIHLVEEMPHWIPAQDEMGRKVPQSFVFKFGQEGC